MTEPGPSSSSSSARRKRKANVPQFSDAFLNEYEAHVQRLKTVHESKKEATAIKNVVTDKDVLEAADIWDTLGKRQPGDRFNGCVNLRTLRTLLKMIDDRGFERSEHQMQFHSAFERCVSRVVYKGEWASERTAIMQHNSWEKANSEVMISTPRYACYASFLCKSLQLPCSFCVLIYNITHISVCVCLLFRRFGKTFRYAAHTF